MPKQKLGRCHLNHCRYPVQGNSWFDFFQALLTIDPAKPQSRKNVTEQERELFSVVFFSSLQTHPKKGREKNDPEKEHCHWCAVI